MMDKVVEWCLANHATAQLLWVACACAGNLVLWRIRPEHYANRSDLWKLGYAVWTILVGPAMLVFAAAGWAADKATRKERKK